MTYTEAKDAMRQRFYDKWRVESPAIVGYTPDVYWKNTEKDFVPPRDKYWCRFSTQTVIEGQDTLSTCVGEPGKLRYEAQGLVIIQLFCPKSDIQADEKGSKLAEIARDAFRGKNINGVWFRNARINDGLTPEDLYYRFNVVAEFIYNEIA